MKPHRNAAPIILLSARSTPTVPTEDLGVPVLNIDELDDIELYFYHYAVSRQMPESGYSVMAEGGEGAVTAPREIPFPYNLRYESGGEQFITKETQRFSFLCASVVNSSL
jgi:hypothetical protein